MWAYNEGGWENPQIIDEFKEYVQTVVDALSDKVQLLDNVQRAGMLYRVRLF